MQVHTRATIRSAVEAALQAWMPWTLARVCEAAGLELEDFIDPPEDDAYRELHDIDQLMGAQAILPAVAIVVPSARFDGPGRTQNARWDLVVNIASRGASHEETVLVNDLLCAAVRTVLHQHQSLGGLASALTVDSEEYRPLASSARLILSGVIRATVITTGATPLQGAPAEAPADPLPAPDPLPDVTSVHVSARPQERP